MFRYMLMIQIIIRIKRRRSDKQEAISKRGLNGSPAILIELGYIKGEDLDYLTDNLRLNKMMQTIGDSIIDQMKINQD